MKKIYRFNIHQYSPEQNRFEVLTSEQPYLQIYTKIELPAEVTKQFTNDYKSNMQIVRRYYKSLHDGKQSLKKIGYIQFQNSNERMNEYSKKVTGLYNDYATIKEVIKRYKDINEGYKQLFKGLDSNKNSIYETVYNKVSYQIKVKVKWLKSF